MEFNPLRLCNVHYNGPQTVILRQHSLGKCIHVIFTTSETNKFRQVLRKRWLQDSNPGSFLLKPLEPLDHNHSALGLQCTYAQSKKELTCDENILKLRCNHVAVIVSVLMW